MIGSLRVVHIQEYVGTSEEASPLKKFVKIAKPFSASTCTRHVYLFMKNDSVESLIPELEKNAKKFEYLQGSVGYNFLLRWLVGLESPKNEHNDRFVLGKAREVWTAFTRKKEKAAPYINMMSFLFEDASAVRKIIEKHQEAKSLPIGENYLNFVKSLCTRCTWARERGIKADYESLELNEANFQENSQSWHIKAMTKQLQHLELRLSNSDLSESNESTKDMQRAYETIKARLELPPINLPNEAAGASLTAQAQKLSM